MSKIDIQINRLSQWLQRPFIKYSLIVALLIFAFLQTTIISPPFSFTNSFVFLRMTIASFLVLILPGYLILSLFKQNTPEDWIEKTVLSLGVSVIFIQLLCIITMELNLNSTKAVFVTLAICLLLVLWNFFKEKKAGFKKEETKATDSGHRLIFILMVLAMIAITIVLYQIGNPVIFGEDQLHVSVIRKFLENDVILKDNVLYRPELAHSYLYPGLYFMSAQISRIAAIDPIIVYEKFRYILGFLSLSILYTFSKSLFKSRYISTIITCSGMAMILSGAAATIPGYYTGLLVPVSHVSDIAMMILLPLSLIFTFKYVASRDGIINRFAIIAPLSVISTMMMHVREGFQILFYYFITLIVFFIFKRRDKLVIKKIAFLLGAVVLLGLIYLPVHYLNEGLVWQAIELPSKQSSSSLFFQTLTGPFNEAFQGVYNGGLQWQGLPYVALALFLAPVLLFWFKKYFWGLFLGGSILASFLIMRFKVFSYLAMLITYSEIMISPSRFVLYFGFIIFGLSVFAGVVIVENSIEYFKKPDWTRLERFGLAAIVLIGAYSFTQGLFLPLLGKIDGGLYIYGSILLLIWVIIVFVLSRLKYFSPIANKFKDMFQNYKPKLPNLNILVLVSILLAVFVFTFSSRNMYSEYKHRVQPDVTNFESYYKSTQFDVIPFDLVEYIRRDVKPHNIFAYDLKAERTCIPLIANQYILVGSNLMGTAPADAADYPKFFKDGKQIIFNTEEPVKDKFENIFKFNYTYILINPPYHSLTGIFDKYSCFQKVYDKDNFALYKIDRGQLELTLQHWEG
jgi:hypothetical protein